MNLKYLQYNREQQLPRCVITSYIYGSFFMSELIIDRFKQVVVEDETHSLKIIVCTRTLRTTP